jgi:syntaxin 1B/2/3
MNDLFTSGSFKKYADLKQQVVVDDLESGAADERPDLDRFFEDVEAVKEDLRRLEALYRRLQAAHEESKTAHDARAVKALRARTDADVDQVLGRAKAVKGKLEALDRVNAASRRIPGCGPGSSTDRTRTSVVTGLGKKLKDLMDDFQVTELLFLIRCPAHEQASIDFEPCMATDNEESTKPAALQGLRTRMAAEYKETVARRYYTVTGEKAEDSTVEALISSGQSETFLHKAIQEQGRGQVLDTISEIQERHDAVKEMERSLLDLHQVFLDMAALVEAQGHQLNDIKSHVMHASSFVRRGAVELEVAKEYQKSSRKWGCIAIVAGVVLPILVNLHLLAIR